MQNVLLCEEQLRQLCLIKMRHNCLFVEPHVAAMTGRSVGPSFDPILVLSTLFRIDPIFIPGPVSALLPRSPGDHTRLGLVSGHLIPGLLGYFRTG